MPIKCKSCSLDIAAGGESCPRCGARSVSAVGRITRRSPRARKTVIRIGFCLTVAGLIIAAFFLSLLLTSAPISPDQKNHVEGALRILRERGFEREAVYIEGLGILRSTDNWFNALVPKENAFAATNFPFAIITLYPDFFVYPQDDVERAAILLHESRHLIGGDEADAYGYVWKNRHKLGWTRDAYGHSPIWSNVRRQTREEVPSIFACPGQEFDDCTEWATQR